MHTFEDVLKFGVSMMSIVNPLGAIPIFLGFTQKQKSLNIYKISSSAALTTCATLLLSLFFGQVLLRFFGISIPSFTIGGGVLLFSTSLGMISTQQSLAHSELAHSEPTFVPPTRSNLNEREIGVIPLAIPMLAGPGAISISIIEAKRFDTTMHWVGAVLVILLLGGLIKLILNFAQPIGERVGPLGISIMTRIMGLILLATSIEMLASGLRELLPALKGTFGFFA